MSVSIKNLEQYGENGWKWTVEVTEFDGTSSKNYRTNRLGDGLWQCGSYEGQWARNYEDHQVKGTCQFSLPRRKNAARSKLYRQFRDE